MIITLNTNLYTFDKKNWQPLYGAFDCYLNSTSLYLKNILNIDISDLTIYNFNIACSERTLTFNGTIPIEKLMEYLTEKLNIPVNKINEFEGIPSNCYFLIALDSFDLPYIKEDYQTRHQLHYILAFNTFTEIILWDPYHMSKIHLSFDFFKKSWLRYCSSIYLLGTPTIKTKPTSSPYILSQHDYESEYQNVYLFIKKQFDTYSKLQNSFGNEKKEMETKLFGMIRSILFSRLTYFTYQPRFENYEHIINQWRATEKFFFKIPLLTNGEIKFFDSLQDVFEMEISHLKNYSI